MSSVDSFDPREQKLAWLDGEKRWIKDQMGGDKFKKCYEYLVTARKKDVDDAIIVKGINKIVGKDKAAYALATTLDQIVFQELQI